MLETIPRTKLILVTATLLWLAGTAFAMNRLSQFEDTAGRSGHPPLHWQHSATVALKPTKPTVIMLVHPQCPCSRASLRELNRLVALCPNRASFLVLFLKPSGYPQAWVNTDLWRQASSIPGVTARVDDGGEIAQRFGAATSGDTLLYASDGRLLYEGGLTGARGHEGDNAGLSAVEALLLGTSKTEIRKPVYGCPMTANRQTAMLGGRAWLP
ncbi:MAG: hypothetical protein ACRYFS_14945 [Janthinobacterium lividum]